MKYTVEENGNVRVVEDDTSPNYSQYTPPKTRKKGKGCGCLIAIVLLVAIALFGYFAYNWWINKSQKTINRPLETSSITSSSQQANENSQESANSDYIIVGSDSRFISESELEGLTADELCLARNEIFARHGRIFTTDWIHKYFIGKSWYKEKYSPSEFDNVVDSLFNKYEKENIKIIKGYEKKMGYQ